MPSMRVFLNASSVSHINELFTRQPLYDRYAIGRVQTSAALSRPANEPPSGRLRVRWLTGWLKRSLIVVHRWVGVVLALLFMLWFTSGIVMMYWTYPGVEDLDRLARAPRLLSAVVRLTADQAYARLGREEPPSQVVLTSFDGRPIYRFDGGNPNDSDVPSMVYADDGTVQRIVSPPMIDRSAALWTGRPIGSAVKTTVATIDQWTIGLRTSFPLHKYSWANGEQVYVDGEKAAIVQYTTRSSRFWAWLGAIPHWLYFTPIRRVPQRWFSLVVWSSAIGVFSSASGIVIAVWMLSPRKRYRHAGVPTSIPYRGWKRWHTVVGLCFGVVALTWVFSGLLSMGPFDVVDALVERTVGVDQARPSAAGAQGALAMVEAFSASGPLVLSSFADRTAADAIAAVPDFEVKELELGMFDGRPLYVATDFAGDTRVIPVSGPPTRSHDITAVMRAVRAAAGTSLADLRVLNEYDAYYLDRHHERPLPVVLAVLNDVARTRFYIDPRTASIAGSYSARGWVDRWLYHGLHSLDFPWLYRYRPLWDIVVLTLLIGGNALCATSLVLAWRVVMRKLQAAFSHRRVVSSDDLALE
jgi:hypothetical protein